MTGAEFVRKIKKIAKNREIPCTFAPERGKGSHGTLYYGRSFTIIRNLKDELKTGSLNGMLKQLGLTNKDLQ